MEATRTRAQPIWFIDNLVRVHADGELTSGAYCLLEFAGRRDDMPPLHRHRREHELFHVLEGRLRLFVPGEAIELEPGASFLAPRDVPHAYRVESELARWLVSCSPAGFERFVGEVGEPAAVEELPPLGRPNDAGALAAAAAGYGIEILGPPGELP